MIAGVEALHEAGFAHRDLKVDNMLVDENWVLKIADFGHQGPLMGEDGSGLLYSPRGTAKYNGPERSIGNCSYRGDKIDIFALGVSLVVMLTLKYPFERAS